MAAQCLHDLRGKIILQLEQIRELAVVGLRPDLETTARIHQSRADPNALAGAAHTSLQYGRHTQIAPNTADVGVAAFVGE